MATQRIISGEKTILDKDDIADPAAGTQSSIAPAVPTYVLMPLSFPFPSPRQITTAGVREGGLRGG